MAVTLSDVARQAGVSTATVSRVLNDKMVMPIPAETIARIRHAAEELNYRPNSVARALATGRTQTIGLFSQEMTDPHFAQMLEAVQARALARGYHVVVSGSRDALAHGGRTDGTIYLGSPEVALPMRHPVVYVNNSLEARPGLIAWSDAEGMAGAVEHLVGLGHRAIAALWCYGSERTSNQQKVQGFRAAAAACEVATTECWEKESTHASAFAAQFEDGYRATWRLLDRATRVTAIVARNDFLALGALRALREARLRVPADMSVVGYTDSIQALCADPPLTSVRTPIALAGERAVDHLLAQIEGRSDRFDEVLLPTHWTVRESSGPASAETVYVVPVRGGYFQVREVRETQTRS